MLFITCLSAFFTVITADIDIDSYKESRIRPIVECLLNHPEIYRSYKPTLVIFDRETINKTLEYNATIDTIINAVQGNIPLTMTNNADVAANARNNKKGTLFILTYFENCGELKQLDKVQRRAKYLLIIDAILDENCKAIAETILNIFSLYDIAIIITNQSHRNFTVLNLIPQIDENTCHLTENSGMRIIIINCQDDYVLNEKGFLFPIKTPTDFMNCTFNVGMATLYPYAMIKNKDKLKNLDLLEDVYGSDVELMKIIFKYYNATLNMYYIFREEENPYLHLELVEYLSNGTLDACAGGLYRVYGDAVSYSGIYTRQSVIWVYAVGEKVRSWQSLILKMRYLYIFLMYYVCYSIIWTIMYKFDRREYPVGNVLLYSWGALFSATSLPQAFTLKQRILNIVYLIMSVYLSSYISTQIYSYLTIQEPPQHLHTMEELMMSDKTPYLRYSTKFFVQDKKYVTFANSSRDCAGFYDCLEMTLKHEGSTIVLDGYLPPLQASTAVNDEARVLKVTEDVIVVYHEMVIRKNHIITNSFKKILRRLFEAGICDKLYEEAIGITVVDKAKIVNKNSMTNSYSCTLGCKITLLQSAGAFYLLMIGALVSFCVFILEVLSAK